MWRYGRVEIEPIVGMHAAAQAVERELVGGGGVGADLTGERVVEPDAAAAAPLHGEARNMAAVAAARGRGQGELRHARALARTRAALCGRGQARIERADVADPAFRPPRMAARVAA